MSDERLDAYYIREVETKEGVKESYWNRIGSAWVNRDGSINVRLFLTPANGEIHLRKPRPKPAANESDSQPGTDLDFPEVP
jgi:hypothetical protein